MSTPQILDTNGHPLSVGMRVKRPGFQMIGQVTHIDADGGVYVSWPGQPLGLPFRSRRRFTARPSYRCPDLEAVLTPDPEEKR
jgi:hypothetical protein